MKKILKFGGSSIGDASCFQQVARIIKSQRAENDTVYVVLSAIKGITDQLLDLAWAQHVDEIDSILGFVRTRHLDIVQGLDIQDSSEVQELLDDLRTFTSRRPTDGKAIPAWRDELLSFGERLSGLVMVAYLNQLGHESEPLDARMVILTNDDYGNAYVHYQRSYNRIRDYLKSRFKLQIITGFLGATDAGVTTTLGRSGSDYTASIFGAALNVDLIEIWTDVDGIMTANPAVVDEARSIKRLTYEEAMELAHAGAKVIFPPTMIPALYKQIPIQIKNTFHPDGPGSMITQERLLNDRITVGLSSLSHISLLRLQGAGMVGVRGINARLFTCLAANGISIMLVSQAFSEHSTCLAIKPEEKDRAIRAIEAEFSHELKLKYIDKVSVESELSLVAVVGEGMKSTPGVAGKVFAILGETGINVEAIAQGASGRNLSFIVRDDQVKKAILALHRILFKGK